MKIDFGKKQTEAQWNKTFDDFWKKVIPHWFTWLEWVIIIGAIKFLANQTHNIVLVIIYTVSYLGFFFYLQSFFYSIEFSGFSYIKSLKIRRLISILLSGIFLLITWIILSITISQIQGKM